MTLPRPLHRLAAATLLLTSGCAAVPKLAPAPIVAPPSAYVAEQSFGVTSQQAQQGWPDLNWWTAYGDPQLDALIAEALVGSPDVAVAAARVRRADGYAQEAGAARLPTLDVVGEATAVRQSQNNGVPAAFVPKGWNDSGKLQAQFGFDLDLWGRNRASYAASRSDAAAARLDFAQSALTLSTEIADAYADLAQFFAQRAVQVTALDVREQTARLTADRVAIGLDTQAELKQAQSDVPSARADILATDEQIALTRNRVAALLGKGPDRGLAIAPPTIAIASRGLPADVTTDLIGRRPDIVAARTRVEAEASRIKVARADFYPSVSISALIGVQALGLDNLFKSGSRTGSVGPAISLPIFRGGELQGRYRAARATYDEAVASYDKTVTDAYRAVADAAVSQRALVRRLAESQQALADAQGASTVARQRFEGGLSRYLDVLSAQDRVLRAQRIVADLRSRAFTLDVALVRALGGGFSAPADGRAATLLAKEKTDG